jgi:hypothetical protein
VKLSGLHEVNGVVDDSGSDKGAGEHVHGLGRETSKVTDDDGGEEEGEDLEAVGVDRLETVGDVGELEMKRPHYHRKRCSI